MYKQHLYKAHALLTESGDYCITATTLTFKVALFKVRLHAVIRSTTLSFLSYILLVQRIHKHSVGSL